MASFTKPWEQYLRNSEPVRFVSQVPELGLRPSFVRQPIPPLPPRPSTFTRQRHLRYNGFMNSGFGDYGNYYSPYTSSLYRQPEYENRYIQLAEESAQPAFDSIETFIRGFSSVTMMLESTFQAMNMSFRAVLGVVENMTKMRTAFVEFLSAFALLKAIHSFYKRILYFLGLVNGMEHSWKLAEKTVHQPDTISRNRQWPILAFLGAIIVGPTLVYKYLLPVEEPSDEVKLVGIYEFEAENPGEVSFAKGDKMTARRSDLKNNWIFVNKSGGTGYVPYNRVALLTDSDNPKSEAMTD